MDPRRALIAFATATLVAVAALADDAALPGASIGGTIRDAKGKPIAGAAVSVEGGGSSKTDADGTWTVAGVASGDVLVTAQSPGRFRVQTMRHVAAGETRTWDATIGMHGKISGHVVDEYGHPLSGSSGKEGPRGWQVFVRPAEEWMQRPDSECWDVLTDANGAFSLRVSPDALFRLCVRNLDSWSCALMTEPMSGGLADVTLRVLPASMPHARVRCRLENSKGTALAGEATAMDVWLYQRDDFYGGHLRCDAATGEWSSGRLVTGRYAVVASHPRCGTFEFPEFDVRDAADVDLGALRFPATGRVRFVPARSGPGSDTVVRLSTVRFLSHCEPDAHRPWYGGTAPVAELRGDAAVEMDFCPGRNRTTPFVPGPPFVGIERVEVPFEVRSGETTTVTVPVRGAPLRTVHFRYPGTSPSQVLFELSDAAGIVEMGWWSRPTASSDPQLCLVPGRHSVVVFTSDRRRLTATLDIPAENAPDVFDVVLR